MRLDLFAVDRLIPILEALTADLTALVVAFHAAGDAEWATDWYRDPGSAWWEQ
jgi:hypothetical protein